MMSWWLRLGQEDQADREKEERSWREEWRAVEPHRETQGQRSRVKLCVVAERLPQQMANSSKLYRCLHDFIIKPQVGP